MPANASRDAADALLRAQTALLELQKSRLEDERVTGPNRSDAVERNLKLTQLRQQRLYDYGRTALMTASVFVAFLVVLFLGWQIWDAARDDDLVIDGFTVPKDVADSGLTGVALSRRILDSYGQKDAGVFSVTQAAATWRDGDEPEIHLEIPETGILVGDLRRFLRASLGHETHVTGELVHVGTQYVLNMRIGTKPGESFEALPPVPGVGPADSTKQAIDNLVDQAAEKIFLAISPLRYTTYLVANKRMGEAEHLMVDLSWQGDEMNVARVFATWSEVKMAQGNAGEALQKAQQAVNFDPHSPLAYGALARVHDALSHEEDELDAATKAIALWHGRELRKLQPIVAAYGADNYLANRSMLLGDFPAAMTAEMHLSKMGARDLFSAEEAVYLASAEHDVENAEAWASAIPQVIDGKPNAVAIESQIDIDLARENWTDAVAKSNLLIALLKDDPGENVYVYRNVKTNLADALSASGRGQAAWDTISSTPADCDECIRMRADIFADLRQWAGAAEWFGYAVQQAPDIPEGYLGWGEMLLKKGDLDGAMVKFRQAHAKGPHYADPLEEWGEALIAKNRSDLAVAKFAAAAEYAPNWGRLHLKWGEALYWSGDAKGAADQVDAASQLFLTPYDQLWLSRMRECLAGKRRLAWCRPR